MRQFAKLDLSIIDSSIWFQPDHVFRVWMVMICKRNYRTGIVKNTVLGLARDAGRTLEETRDALRVLHEPDPESRTKDHDGRRIETVEGGWHLLNHDVYNEMISAEEERERKRKWASENRVAKSSGRVAKSSDYVDACVYVSSTSSGVDPRSDLLSTDLSGSDPDPEIASDEPRALGPTARERGEWAPTGAQPVPKFEWDPEWLPTLAHQARGFELGLNDQDIADELEDCRRKIFTRAFKNEDDQFYRELKWAADDKTIKKAKEARSGANWEKPGHQRHRQSGS